MIPAVARIVASDEGLEELGEKWRRLAELTGASVFSSFDYNLLAWRHFRRPKDRLCVVVVDRGEAAELIAPLCITRRRWRGLAIRLVRFIGAWEGDRPDLLTAGSREDAWRQVLGTLVRVRGGWDALHLMEQPAEGPEGRGWSCLKQPCIRWEQAPDAIGYFLEVQGTWDEHLASIGARARTKVKRDARLLREATGGYRLESVRDPSAIRDAVSRFSALERAGWKAEAGVGLAKDARHRAFYEELLERLALQGRCAAFFLTCDAGDVAGDIWLFERDVAYARHTAYSPEYARSSPGNVLHADVLRHLWTSGFRELDLLTLHEGPTRPLHKALWATGRRQTVMWTGYRRGSRAHPFILLRRLKQLVAGSGGSL
jgi:CelD/BcsL family acetyltransferase involved in cellulose biosynthesis